MGMSASVSKVPPSSEGRMTEWCYFVLDHLNEFAKLAWYLVADTQMVENVMLRAIVRLESTPFDAPDELVRYNQARDTLIAEAIAVLGLPESGNVEMTRPPSSATRLPAKAHSADAGERSRQVAEHTFRIRDRTDSICRPSSQLSSDVFR